MNTAQGTPKLTPEDSALIRRKIREMHDRIIPTLSREDVHGAARDLELLHQGMLIFKDEHFPFYDYLIYSYRPKGINLAGRYLREHGKGLDPVSRTVLKSMSQALYCIFTFVPPKAGVKPAKDRVTILDVLSGEQHLLVDPAMIPRTVKALKDTPAAAHLLFFDGFVMQSGSLIGLGKQEDAFQHLKELAAEQTTRRQKRELHSTLAQAFIMMFMASDKSRKISYE